MSTLTAEPTARYFVTGGTLSAEARSYIERAADKSLLSALMASRFAYVLNSRQMGKSSLCVRTMKRLEEAGICTFFVDLTKIGGKTATIEQWYTGIAVELGKTPELRSKILGYWKENSHLSPMQRLFGVLRDVIPQFTDQPVAIFFDEIDATRSLSFSADEFFAAIRECYNRRVQDPTYDRLTFCLLGVAVPSDLINSPTSTPFNIGERIYLRDFTLEEAESLAAGLGPNGRALLDRAFYWTNGHPYLTQSLCSAIAADPAVNTPDDVDALVKRDLFEPTARETNINLADVANRALHAGDLEAEPEKFRADILSAYDKARSGKVVADDEANRVTALLKLSGIMRSEGKRLYVRNRIYEHVFDRDWIRENMPGQELRRQKRAFYLGVLRTGLVALGVVAIITALSINSLRLARIAAEQRDLAKYEAYAADVNLMRTAYTDNDLILLTNLLQETKDSPNRNIEWNYWNAKLHDANYEIDSPHGFGNVIVSHDGRSVGITDVTEKTGAIYTYPDLRLIHRIDHLPASEFLGELGERWVTVTVSSISHQQVRDAISGKLLGSFDYGKAGALINSLSPGGHYLASAWIAEGDRYAQDVTIWNGTTFQSAHHFKVKGHRISSVSVSDDGRYLATEEVDSESPSIVDNYYAGRRSLVRDLVTGAEVDSFSTGGVPFGFQLSGDGRFLGIGLETSGTLVVRDVRAHKFIMETPCPTVGALKFSDDDSKLLTIGDDIAASLWDLESGKLIYKKQGAMAADIPRDASSVVVSGAGTRVYTSANVTTDSATIPNSWANLRGINDKGWLVVNTGNALRFLDANTFQTAHPTVRSVAPNFSVSADANWRLDSSPTGGQIVNNGTDRVLCAISTWNSLGTAMDLAGGSVAALDSDQHLATCYDLSGRELWHCDFKTSPAACCRFSPDGKVLAVSTNDGIIHLLDAANGTLERDLTGNDGFVLDLLFSHDSKKLAVVGEEFKVLIFDVAGDHPPVVCRGHHATVEDGAFSPDDTRFASASDDGTVRFWDPKTGKQMLQIDVGKVPATGIAFDPTGDRFYVSDYTGMIKRYNAPKA